MQYVILADMVVVVHMLFVLFVVFGGLFVLRWRRSAWVHLPAVFWGAVIELGDWVCPLTYLENYFRRLGGEAGYNGSFIQRYLEPLLYPIGLTRSNRIILGIAVILINAAVYGRLWWLSRRDK